MAGSEVNSSATCTCPQERIQRLRPAGVEGRERRETRARRCAAGRRGTTAARDTREVRRSHPVRHPPQVADVAQRAAGRPCRGSRRRRSRPRPAPASSAARPWSASTRASRSRGLGGSTNRVGSQAQERQRRTRVLRHDVHQPAVQRGLHDLAGAEVLEHAHRIAARAQGVRVDVGQDLALGEVERGDDQRSRVRAPDGIARRRDAGGRAGARGEEEQAARAAGRSAGASARSRHLADQRRPSHSPAECARQRLLPLPDDVRERADRDLDAVCEQPEQQRRGRHLRLEHVGRHVGVGVPDAYSLAMRPSPPTRRRRA